MLKVLQIPQLLFFNVYFTNDCKKENEMSALKKFGAFFYYVPNIH